MRGAVRAEPARSTISNATVKTHVSHIFAKLGVNDGRAAIAYAAAAASIGAWSPLPDG